MQLQKILIFNERLRQTRSGRLEVSRKKVLLEISQNSQENTCARVSFLIKLKLRSLQRTPLAAASEMFLKVSLIPQEKTYVGVFF